MTSSAAEDDWSAFVRQVSSTNLSLSSSSLTAPAVEGKEPPSDEAGPVSPLAPGKAEKAIKKKKSKKIREEVKVETSKITLRIKVHDEQGSFKSVEIIEVLSRQTCEAILTGLCETFSVSRTDYILKADDSTDTILSELLTPTEFGTDTLLFMPVNSAAVTSTEKSVEEELFGDQIPSIFGEDINVEIRVTEPRSLSSPELEGSLPTSPRIDTPELNLSPEEEKGGSLKRNFFSLTRSISSKMKKQVKEVNTSKEESRESSPTPRDIDWVFLEPGSPVAANGSLPGSPPLSPISKTASSRLAVEETVRLREPKERDITKRLSLKKKTPDSSKKKVESIFFSPADSTATSPERRPPKVRDESRRRSFLPWLQKGSINRARVAEKNVNPTEFLMKGALSKRGKIIKVWHPKIAVLTAQGIYFFDKEDQISGGSWKSFILLGEITRINKIKDESSGKKYSVRIVSPTGETYLAAASEEELEAWLEKITPHTKAGDEVEEEPQLYLNRYEAGRTIGVGGYAEVKIGRDLKTEKKVAIKVIKKDLADGKGLERLEREISFLCCINHQNIVKLLDVYEGEATTVLVMEFVDGETLDDFVYEAKGQCLPEFVCKFLFKKLFSAVQYIHSLYVVHRDLKMENIMVNSQGDLWLLDFGLSAKWQPGTLLETFCGTLEYAAPEVVSKEKAYEGGPCDVWSLGVILFSMLTGRFPFEEENVPLILEKMQQGFKAISFPSTISPDALGLFQAIFTPDPEQRATLETIAAHPWMKDDEAERTKAQAFFASLE